MITAYLPQGGQLQRIQLTPDSVLPEGTVWVDLLEPTQDEEKAIERLLEIEMPTREEMQEIETSSRLYREGDASYMTANILYHAETPVPLPLARTVPHAVVGQNRQS